MKTEISKASSSWRRTEICMGTFEVEEPGDFITVDPYQRIYLKSCNPGTGSIDGVQALVDLLHQKDREIESWKRVCEKAVGDYEKRNLDYWELRKEYGVLMNHTLELDHDRAVRGELK